jgi:hypothetical protein
LRAVFYSKRKKRAPAKMRVYRPIFQKNIIVI